MMHNNTLWTARDVADYLKVSTNTLQNWRCAGQGPMFLKLGKAVRYRYADVIAWATGSVVAA